MMSATQMQDDSTKDDDKLSEDSDLFRREMQGVKPLKPKKRVQRAQQKKPIRVRQKEVPGLYKPFI